MNNENRIAAYDISLDDVVRDGGYYDRFGLWNSIVKIDGRLLRGRVEVFIFKDDKIFAADAKNGLLRVPGGSFTKGISNETQCYLEAKEEARLLIKNVEYSGYHYIRIYDKIYTSHEKNFIPCDGTYNEIYIAEYDGDYNGFIKAIDADKKMYETGKWYSVEELYIKLPPNQQKFLEMKFPDKVSNLPKNSEVVKEEVNESLDIAAVEKDKYDDKIDSFTYILGRSSINSILEASEMGQIEGMNLLKEENKLFPYYLPMEMEKLGVFNQGYNLYAESVMDDYSVDFIRKYKENTFAGVDQRWYDTLMERYIEFQNEETDYNRQRILDLGWNPEIPVTRENVISASEMTKKRLADANYVDLTSIIEEMGKDIFNERSIDIFPSGWLSEYREYGEARLKEISKEELLQNDETTNIDDETGGINA